MTTTSPVLDILDTTDASAVAHIIHDAHPKAKITEAIVNGTTLFALCGIEFVPSRDPDRLPVCKECKQIKDELMTYRSS